MITIFMIFKLGIKYRYIVIAFLLALVLLPVIYNFLPDHAKSRIDVFLNPELDPLGDGYNAIQSKIAVGAGMLLGSGYLQGSQTQYDYLPVQSSDFIFSVISEEMGFIVSAIVVVLYLILLLRVLKVASEARDLYTSFGCCWNSRNVCIPLYRKYRNDNWTVTYNRCTFAVCKLWW